MTFHSIFLTGLSCRTNPSRFRVLNWGLGDLGVQLCFIVFRFVWKVTLPSYFLKARSLQIRGSNLVRI